MGKQPFHPHCHSLALGPSQAPCWADSLTEAVAQGLRDGCFQEAERGVTSWTRGPAAPSPHHLALHSTQDRQTSAESSTRKVTGAAG